MTTKWAEIKQQSLVITGDQPRASLYTGEYREQALYRAVQENTDRKLGRRNTTL